MCVADLMVYRDRCPASYAPATSITSPVRSPSTRTSSHTTRVSGGVRIRPAAVVHMSGTSSVRRALQHCTYLYVRHTVECHQQQTQAIQTASQRIEGRKWSRQMQGLQLPRTARKIIIFRSTPRQASNCRRHAVPARASHKITKPLADSNRLGEFSLHRFWERARENGLESHPVARSVTLNLWMRLFQGSGWVPDSILTYHAIGARWAKEDSGKVVLVPW